MENDILYTIKPKFKFFYELFMPTGRRFKRIFRVIVTLILILLVFNILSNIGMFKELIREHELFEIISIVNWMFVVFIIIMSIMLTINVGLQMLQYRAITYNFYDTYLEYRDTFLNQNRRTIQYSNIREIEVMRTIWDRVNKLGIIVVYTNAEKRHDNGLVIYGVQNPDTVYRQIDDIIHRYKVKTELSKENISNNSDNANSTYDTEEAEKTFKESLKNIENEE